MSEVDVHSVENAALESPIFPPSKSKLLSFGAIVFTIDLMVRLLFVNAPRFIDLCNMDARFSRSIGYQAFRLVVFTCLLLFQQSGLFCQEPGPLPNFYEPKDDGDFEITVTGELRPSSTKYLRHKGESKWASYLRDARVRATLKMSQGKCEECDMLLEVYRSSMNEAILEAKSGKDGGIQLERSTSDLESFVKNSLNDRQRMQLESLRFRRTLYYVGIVNAIRESCKEDKVDLKFEQVDVERVAGVQREAISKAKTSLGNAYDELFDNLLKGCPSRLIERVRNQFPEYTLMHAPCLGLLANGLTPEFSRDAFIRSIPPDSTPSEWFAGKPLQIELNRFGELQLCEQFGEPLPEMPIICSLNIDQNMHKVFGFELSTEQSSRLGGMCSQYYASRGVLLGHWAATQVGEDREKIAKELHSIGKKLIASAKNELIEAQWSSLEKYGRENAAYSTGLPEQIEKIAADYENGIFARKVRQSLEANIPEALNDLRSRSAL
jgi:hypothetical protein